MGSYSTTVGVMQLVASLIAGALWNYAGHESIFSSSALFAVFVRWSRPGLDLIQIPGT